MTEHNLVSSSLLETAGELDFEISCYSIADGLLLNLTFQCFQTNMDAVSIYLNNPLRTLSCVHC